ncbi:hypothetical protein LTR08_006335 [Meristemomyces frigidus]|nr:hypothetical protein LTR08_006335 [Meristemomyces frigidus]
MDPPEIPILLLGDEGVGKSTFLSRLTLGSTHPPNTPLPLLRPLDQPYPFNISLYARPYRFTFSTPASPTHYTLLRPAVLILCYSIADPASLANLRTKWKPLVETHFNHDEALPVIVLGLQRDVRERADYDGRVRQPRPELNAMGQGDEGDEDMQVLNGRPFVYPQEALRVAQEMRCDRYCECSALTGEVTSPPSSH